MSWTDIFPVLSDEMLDAYRQGASGAELAQYDEWLGVERICPAKGRKAQPPDGVGKTKPHVVSATLFWKHVIGADPDLPKPTRERLVMAKRMGLVKRFSPWESYVEPLIRYSPGTMERHPNVRFRLYLARDLDFLINDFTTLGWEVFLMKSPSLRYCPGGFWGLSRDGGTREAGHRH
jgi:hypothetical protein